MAKEKLTEFQLNRLAKMYKSRLYTQKQIGELFGMSPTGVHLALKTQGLTRVGTKHQNTRVQKVTEWILAQEEETIDEILLAIYEKYNE